MTHLHTYRTWGMDADRGEDWRLSAACRDHDPEKWFPIGNTTGRLYLAKEQQALRVCAHCPVREACGDFAVKHLNLVGVWGMPVAELRRRVTAHINTDSRAHLRKTVCKYGHRFTEDNTYWAPDGKRQCRVCHNANKTRSAGRKKEASCVSPN